MREDMSHVLVERPRQQVCEAKGRRRELARDPDNAPRREAISRGRGGKSLNENLRPLVRFLRSHTGQPWNKVRAEMAAELQLTNAVERHVMVHLKDYVAEKVYEQDGALFWHSSEGPQPLTWRLYRERFYVCPKTGLLLTVQREVVTEPPPDPDRKILPNGRVLQRVKGLWFELTLTPIPTQIFELAQAVDILNPGVYLISYSRREGVKPPYGRPGVYASAKRQLGRKELRAFGLVQGYGNDLPEPDPSPRFYDALRR